MGNGFIRLKMNELDRIKLLRNIYEHEATKLSRPGSYHRDINDVLWSLSELAEASNLNEKEVTEIKNLFEWLEERRQLMTIREEGKEDRYISRIAETVRLMGHCYEFWHLGRPGVQATRWLVADKKVPRRDIKAEDFISNLNKMLQEEGIVKRRPNLPKAIELVVKGVSGNLTKGDWKRAMFSDFQLISTKEMLKAQYVRGYHPQAQILTAGVGGGKTIAFSMAILVSAMEGMLGGERERRTHLLVYPRTALAKDQFNTIRGYAQSISEQFGRNVHLEHVDYHTQKHKSLRKGIPLVYKEGHPPPDIIVITLETLKRRLQEPLFTRSLSRYLERVVLDEIHLVEGLTGSHVIQLMNRLRSVLDHRPLWTAASATVASPERHAAMVFGLKTNDVRVIEPEKERMELAGLAHHVFIKPSGLISTAGVLVNNTSILVHNRRDRISDRPGQTGNQPKAIGFADNLDMLGRWNADLRENERTEVAKNQREHPSREDPNDWRPQEREIPYALRFHNPFTRRLRAEHGQTGGDNEPYEPLDALRKSIMNKIGEDDPCSKCREGERIDFGRLSKEDMKKLGRIVVRHPTKKDDQTKRFNIMNNLFERGDTNVGTLDLCPYLRAGACFWFPNEDLSAAPIPHTTGLYEWAEQARSKIYSSKTKTSTEYVEDDLSDLVYQGTVKEVFDIRNDGIVPVDIVLASPSLEVGIDLPNVTESMMFKAIRNVASYRQKAGRIGREFGSDVINVSILSGRPIDSHYYRQPRKLVSLAQLDPIPLKEHNLMVVKSALYMGVWDHLALKGLLPERVPSTYQSDTDDSHFVVQLRACREYLDKNKMDVERYLKRLVEVGPEQDPLIISGAIEQAQHDIETLLVPTSGALLPPRIKHLADLVVETINKGHPTIDPSSKDLFDDLDSATNDFMLNKKKLNPLELGLLDEFEALEKMASSGWQEETLEQIITTIQERLKGLEGIEGQRLRLLNVGLEGVTLGLRALKKAGIDPKVVFFTNQFIKRIVSQQRWKAYYLSFIIEELPMFKAERSGSSYIRPKNLFTNPYEPTVELFKGGGRESSEEILVSEALHSFIPGTWTYRLGKDANKVAIGNLNDSKGGVLISELRNIIEADNILVKEKANVDGPPGVVDRRFDIYRPVRLRIKWAPKHVNLDIGSRTVVDDDERGGRKPPNRIKVPISYLERWVNVSPFSREPIWISRHRSDELVAEMEGREIKNEELLRTIRHPLMSKGLSSIDWHDKLEVIEYVYEVGRSYTAKEASGANLVFMNQGREIGFGHLMLTEGVSMELDAKNVESVIENVVQALLNGNKNWMPTAVKALQAMMYSMELKEGARVSPFIINDIISILLQRLLYEMDEDIGIKDILDDLRRLSEEPEVFEELAGRFVKQKMIGISKEIDEEGGLSLKEHELRKDMEREVKRLSSIVSDIPDALPDLEPFLQEWTKQTLLNTFGICAMNALQRLSGTNERNIGYYPDIKGIREGRYRVYLFDRDRNGNGTCKVLKDYMHILYIQRKASDPVAIRLPSDDYLSLLEEELLQCPQFHTDLNALTMFGQERTGTSKVGIPELGYLKEFSKEIELVSAETWQKLGIGGRADAWKLSLYNLTAMMIAEEQGLEVDNVLRATGICWNGCPECVVSDQTLMGGIKGSRYVDKAILDRWFHLIRDGVDEYKSSTSDEMRRGEGLGDIGRKSRVSLRLPDRVLRSVSLPYTIGIELDRERPDQVARLVLRDDDISDLKFPPHKEKDTAMGIMVGFGRLVWYNLLTTAFLEVLGKLKEDEKELLFVFYNISDVPFEDIGLSERMWETIESQRVEDGFNHRLDKLSTFLGWLAKRGFDIKVCIEEKNVNNEHTYKFLKNLHSFDQESEHIKITTKDLGNRALMHGKGFLTPVGIISGSGNLTWMSVNIHEEFLSYSSIGTRGYDDLKISLNDTLKQSKPWRPK